MKKALIQTVALIVFLFLTKYAAAQSPLTKELKWDFADTGRYSYPVFHDTDQIIAWVHDLHPWTVAIDLQLKRMHTAETDVLILRADGCSGLSCPCIYVFKARANSWELFAKTRVRLDELLKITCEDGGKRILFKTETRQLGELAFEDLN